MNATIVLDYRSPPRTLASFTRKLSKYGIARPWRVTMPSPLFLFFFKGNKVSELIHHFPFLLKACKIVIVVSQEFKMLVARGIITQD